MAESIERLRIYKSARALEDQVYELVKQFPADHFYGLGNDLRRSSAAVSHHIMSLHQLSSYRLRLEELAAARRQTEIAQEQLKSARDLGATNDLVEAYTGIIKQSWGLTKWLKSRLQEKQEKTEIVAKEQMAAAVS